jgi:photosynthetic reaction center cytochrome c subunit
MTVGARRVCACATAMAVVCLAAVAGVRAAAAQGGRGGAAAPAGGERVPMVEETFKTVQLLRGIPVDTFFEVMGTFASSMGNDCTFCHASNSALDKSAFATQTPRIQRARQMITMMRTINQQFFGGAPRVTCFTCHGGSNVPKADPSFMSQYGEPVLDPDARDFLTDASINVNQVWDKYIQALGGADKLAKLTSYAAKGTYSGFDTDFSVVPIELYAKAPNQETVVVHLTIGTSTRVFDGQNAWVAGPEQPLPLLTMTGGNIDRARLSALANFPLGLQKAYPQWRAGRTILNDKDVIVLQATVNGDRVAQVFFDPASGLLLRLLRFTVTPVAFVPTQLDYADYRELPGLGVKIPFSRTLTQTYMQMTLKFMDVQPNVAIDAARFGKPAPAKLQSEK